MAHVSKLKVVSITSLQPIWRYPLTCEFGR
jgi:hypothetical protein